MTEILFATLLVYVIHLVLPTLIAVVRGEADIAYLFGPRDETRTDTPVIERARRSSRNLQESLLIFLPLAVLAGENGAVAEAATIWLGVRIAYTLTYLMGLSYIRTAVWFVSLAYLYMMASALV
jgi:uncharacterized MAPEG superfamily protein